MSRALLTRIHVSVVAETPASTPRRYLELLSLLLSEWLVSQ